MGAVSIPSYLSTYLPNHRIIAYSIVATAMIFGCMIIFQYKLPMLIFFALIGFSITTVTTTMTIHLSNITQSEIQGEVLGVQQSLRTMGDALICIFGGMITILSVSLPIILSCLVAYLASLLSKRYICRDSHAE